MFARRLEPSCVVEELDDKSDASWELVGSKSHSRSHSSTSLSATPSGPAAPVTPDMKHLEDEHIVPDPDHLHDALEHMSPGVDCQVERDEEEEYLSCDEGGAR